MYNKENGSYRKGEGCDTDKTVIGNLENGRMKTTIKTTPFPSLTKTKI